MRPRPHQDQRGASNLPQPVALLLDGGDANVMPRRRRPAEEIAGRVVPRDGLAPAPAAGKRQLSRGLPPGRGGGGTPARRVARSDAVVAAQEQVGQLRRGKSAGILAGGRRGGGKQQGRPLCFEPGIGERRQGEISSYFDVGVGGA